MQRRELFNHVVTDEHTAECASACLKRQLQNCTEANVNDLKVYKTSTILATFVSDLFPGNFQ